jgi:hypothetical protein
MEAYPLTIRTILRSEKSRTQPAAFMVAEPRRGFGYVQATGTDVPVFWDVAFRFTLDEAIAFRLWFTQLIHEGVDPFSMPIVTEFGAIDYVCQFLPDSLLPVKQEGGLWYYTATIMARSEIIPQGYIDAAELIVSLPYWRSWAEMLDIAVTQEMPEG